MSPNARQVAVAQAAYYLPTAVLPFLSRRAFQSVTGPKLEWWLVLTVGSLVGTIGASLAAAATRGSITPETRILGTGAAAGLAAIDVVYVAHRRISPVYLIDASIQTAVLAGWLRATDG
jgi:hypothetical protein